jgi:hypothetical protein
MATDRRLGPDEGMARIGFASYFPPEQTNLD